MTGGPALSLTHSGEVEVFFIIYIVTNLWSSRVIVVSVPKADAGSHLVAMVVRREGERQH
jgi:hypothetical protein